MLHHNQVPLISHTHTSSGGKQEDRGGTRPACHNKVKHQQPWSFAITHTASATIKPASPKGTWCWCLWQGSCHSLTHTPQGRGEPWLMTRGVHHGSSHSHTSGQHTSHSATRSGACHGVHQPCHSHTHTKGRGPWIDGQSGIHNMPPQRERERDWMVDSGLVSMDKPLATQQGKRRHHSSHAAITQAYTNNHHTITLTTQAWSWSLTACSLTHEGQGRTRSTPPPSQWCGWLAQ